MTLGTVWGVPIVIKVVVSSVMRRTSGANIRSYADTADRLTLNTPLHGEDGIHGRIVSVQSEFSSFSQWPA